MSLFKYLPPERIDIFSLCRIRFSPPAALNDPLEARPYYDGIAPTADLEQSFPLRFERILREHYQSLSWEMKAKMDFELFVSHFESMRSEIYAIFRRANQEAQPKAEQIMYHGFG